MISLVEEGILKYIEAKRLAFFAMPEVIAINQDYLVTSKPSDATTLLKQVVEQSRNIAAAFKGGEDLKDFPMLDRFFISMKAKGKDEMLQAAKDFIQLISVATTLKGRITKASITVMDGWAKELRDNEYVLTEILAPNFEALTKSEIGSLPFKNNESSIDHYLGEQVKAQQPERFSFG